MVFAISFYFLFLRILTVTTALKEAPCDYMNTGRLTFEDGIYLYDGDEVQKTQTGVYDYEIQVGNKKIRKEPHSRGCICKTIPCISLCCPLGKEFTNNNTCSTTTKEPDLQINLKNDTSGETLRHRIGNMFIMQYYRPNCEGNLTSIEARDKPLKHLIYTNGSMLYRGKLYNKNEYCLNPLIMSATSYLYMPYICADKDPELIRNAKVLIISVPFMLVTILLYMLPRSLTLMVKSTCFYLLTLSVAFTTLPLLSLLPDSIVENNVCSILGYTTYFAFIASYSWVTVVSYELFKNLCKERNSYTECKKFTYYSLFAWGLPTLLLGLTLFAEEQDWNPEYKPNIADEKNCFFGNHTNSKMIYFYGPGIVLISLNIIMFLLTIRDLSVRHLRNAMVRSKLQLYLEKCGLFARLSLVTGVSWIFEFLANCFPNVPILNHLLILVMSQGYFIFLLTILSKSVRGYLKERYQKLYGRTNALGVTQRETMSSTRQTTF